MTRLPAFTEPDLLIAFQSIKFSVHYRNLFQRFPSGLDPAACLDEIHRRLELWQQSCIAGRDSLRAELVPALFALPSADSILLAARGTDLVATFALDLNRFRLRLPYHLLPQH